MADNRVILRLADVVSELRRELTEALATAKPDELELRLGPVELELELLIDKNEQGRGVVFGVEASGGRDTLGQRSQHKVKVTLQLRDSQGRAIRIVDSEATGEIPPR